MKSLNKIKGIFGEKAAIKFLKKEGYSIIDKNFKVKFGEVDIIASKDRIIHFIEVKSKSSVIKGHPYEQVNYSKIRKIEKVSQYYSKVNNLSKLGHSIDIISIVIDSGNKYQIKMFENVTN